MTASWNRRRSFLGREAPWLLGFEHDDLSSVCVIMKVDPPPPCTAAQRLHGRNVVARDMRHILGSVHSSLR